MTSSSFGILENECEDGQADELSLSSGKTLVVGDIKVRYFDRAFCARYRKNRALACFPGAEIRDICWQVFRRGRVLRLLFALVQEDIT